MSAKIDIFAHILPEELVATARQKGVQAIAYHEYLADRTPSLRNLETRFQVTDAFGPDYRQVLVTIGPLIEGGAAGPELARVTNDAMAELVARYPDRFAAFVAGLPLGDIEASLLETDRAIKELGARGIQLYANVNGHCLDEPRFMPLFEQMARYDLPIWLHPYRSAQVPDFQAEDRSRYNVWRVFGWPLETTTTLFRLVLAGLLQRFPDLKIIAHHAGGIFPYLADRAKDHYDEYIHWQDPEVHPLAVALDKHPVEYMRLVYGDTALSGSVAALTCALEFMGSERLLFGSDFPFDIRAGATLVEEAISGVEGLAVSAAEREAIYSGNAKRLLKL